MEENTNDSMRLDSMGRMIFSVIFNTIFALFFAPFLTLIFDHSKVDSSGLIFLAVYIGAMLCVIPCIFGIGVALVVQGVGLTQRRKNLVCLLLCLGLLNITLYVARDFLIELSGNLRLVFIMYNVAFILGHMLYKPYRIYPEELKNSNL